MSNYTHEEVRAMIAGSLFDFAAYLTTPPAHESFPVGAAHPTPPMIDRLRDFAEKRGNTRAWLDHADTRDWNHVLLSEEHPQAAYDRLAKTILRLCPERITEGKTAGDIAADIIKEHCG